MENIFWCLLGMIFLVVLAIPIVFALTVATLLASLFSALFEPVTAWIQGCIEKFSWMFSKRLDAFSFFPAIKKRFRSLPKFLFICFVIIFLVLYYLSLGDVINKSRPGRESEEERICFVTGGLPVWDVGWSYEIYQNALKLGLGQTLKLWDEPYLN